VFPSMMSTFLMQRRLGYFVLCHKLVYEPVIIRGREFWLPGPDEPEIWTVRRARVECIL
jgi:hypothetical protein